MGDKMLKLMGRDRTRTAPGALAVLSFGLMAGTGMLAGASMLGMGCREASQTVASPSLPQEDNLVVLSPHAPRIRDAFATRFSDWHEQKYGRPVSVRWITKGTIESQRDLENRVWGKDHQASQDAYDVFFGGGLAVHQDLAERGFAAPVTLSDHILAAIPKELHGQPLYDPKGQWFGTALSGLGIMYNQAACDARGVPYPATWADLAKPEYQYWVAAANPQRSGSTTQCFVLMLLAEGWEKGWANIVGILANTSGLLPSSQMIGTNVQIGVALAGFEPEFVARMTMEDAAGKLAYASPPASTVLTPDPIIKLKGAPNPQSADRFIEFVLSIEGQSLWALGAADGGPFGKPLFRYPIRTDVYAQFGDKLLVEGNPFAQEDAFRIDLDLQKTYTRLLPVLIEGICANDNHLLLQKAWRVAREQGQDSPAWATLKKPPFEHANALRYAEELAEDAWAAEQLQSEWETLFRTRYEQALGS